MDCKEMEPPDGSWHYHRSYGGQDPDDRAHGFAGDEGSNAV